MCDKPDLDPIDLSELARIVRSGDGRGYDSYFHAPREYKDDMECDEAHALANTLNERGFAIDVSTIDKNAQPFPDCVAMMDGVLVGIEVTEFTVDENERRQFKRAMQAGEIRVPEGYNRSTVQRRRNLGNRLATPVPNAADWPFDKFRRKLEVIVQTKETKARDHKARNTFASLDKVFLLIVTDERDLSEKRLDDYLARIELPASEQFDAIYVMMSPQPGGRNSSSQRPVFEVCQRPSTP